MRSILLLFFIVMLSACRIQRKIYSALPINNPSLQEKNDFSVNATISSPTGFDWNGGFAVTDRFALIAGAYLHKNKDIEHNSGFSGTRDSSNLAYRHNGLTLGAGLYIPVSKDFSTYLSFFGGVNAGSFKMNEELYELLPNPSSSAVANYYKSKLNRYFLQGSINHYGGILDASATVRYTLARYTDVQTDYSDTQLSDYKLPPFISNRTSSFVDFSMESKIYFSKNPRWGIQFFALVSTMTNNDDDPNSNTSHYYYPFRVGTGIFFRGFASKPRK